mmetsp:Transcript_129503/g.192783  ORF Transcript_129503/g.192783 Transcript_129503/m.192783 type:complete len:124 (+) Transcript_129503:135-506(+)
MPKSAAVKFPFQVMAYMGVAILCHAGYSTIQYRKYLRMVGEEFVTSPGDIYLEVLAGMILAFFGVLSMAEDFEPIRMAETFHKKTFDDTNFRQEFMGFNHRGRVLGTLMDAGEMPTGAGKKGQ